MSQGTTTLSRQRQPLSPEERRTLESVVYGWERYVARPNQLEPPGDWIVWLLDAGRGFGKTRTGAEWVRKQVDTGRARRIALVAKKSSEARDVMVEGESGLLSVFPPSQRPKYEPSKRRVTFHNGAIATTYSAEEPDELRGPQHDAAWCDEIAKWSYDEAAWDNLMMGLRLGEKPRAVATTTPRPTKLVKRLLKDPTVHVTKGTTYDNLANLSPAFRNTILQYEGTRLGRQELNAELLEDVEGALWSAGVLDATRVDRAPDMKRILVAIDPAVTAGEQSDETGIVVVGMGTDEHGYVLEDLSGRYSPRQWATVAAGAYERWGADKILGEVNNGGDLVRSNLETAMPFVPFKEVRASRGKYTRAEPVANLYEQGRVHHVGTHPHLEDQLCNWVQGDNSPDRLDALVWGLTELMFGTYTPAQHTGSPWGTPDVVERTDYEKFGTLGQALARAQRSEERRRKAIEARTKG